MCDLSVSAITLSSAAPCRAASAGDRAWRAERRGDAVGNRGTGEPDLLAQERRLPVGDVAVRQPDSHHPGSLTLAAGERILEVLEDAGAEATREDVLLDRHAELVLGGELLEERPVERLCEATVGDRDREIVFGEDRGGVERHPHAVAVADERDRLPLAQHLADADRDLASAIGKRHTLRRSARVAEGDR